MEITILKWDKYNPRKDIKHPSWFALSNRFLEDPDLFGFEPAELKAMLYLFCQASQKNSADVSINFQHAERVCQIKNKDLRSAIEKLSVIGSVRVRTDHERIRTYHERARTQTSRDNTIQDNTNTTDNTEHRYVPVVSDGLPAFSASELLEVWNSNCGTLPKARELGKRASKAQARVREKPDRDYWVDVVSRIAKSNFCNGRSKGSEWRATFDFLVQPDTHLKVLEGKYDNRDGTFDDTNWDRVFQKSVTA